jgi:multidrug efflux pump subunit AcrB
VTITLGYVGAPPPSYPINTIYLWTSGQHEAVLRVALNPDVHIRVDEFEDQLRKSLPPQFPGCQFSFEAADIVTKIMNFGAPTPVEVNVSGPDLGSDRAFAEKVRGEVAQVRALRDLQYDEPLDYPSVNVDIDRERAGQLGVSAVARPGVSRGVRVAGHSARDAFRRGAIISDFAGSVLV